MNYEAILSIAITVVVLATVYFFDSFQEKLFRSAKPPLYAWASQTAGSVRKGSRSET